MAQIKFNRINPADLIRPLESAEFVITDIALGRLRPLVTNFRSSVNDKGQDQNILIPDIEIEEADHQSILNTPVIDSLAFGSETDASQNNYINIDGEVINYEYLNIDAVIMTVSQAKNIVTTSIQGKNGTIKEYISNGDYEITVQGIISSNGSIFPKEDFGNLTKILNSTGQIKVTSQFLQFFSIDNVVIQSYNAQQEQGYRNQQRFECMMLSDSDINLEEVE